MAEQLYTAVTGGGPDCALRRRRWGRGYRYEIRTVFKDIDTAGKDGYWQFTILVPERSPEEFEVKGCNKNPKYTKNTLLQQSRKEEVRQKVYSALYRVLEQSEAWKQEQQDAYDEYAELHGK